MGESLLEIKNLVTSFPWPEGELKAVDGLDLNIRPAQILGLVGESGCGKSMTALSILGLVPSPGRVSRGSIKFKGEELLGASTERLQKIRGAEISMIFQEPMTSLNPVFTVGRQISELILAHRKMDKKKAWELTVESLAQVGIADPENRAGAYPHQLSGGMRQRVVIAMALALKPALIIADEPTTALDVTIQAQILGLMESLQQKTQSAFLLITHNLAVVAKMAHRVAVMYTGRLVEQADVTELFDHPLHPYTKGLMACLPSRSQELGVDLPTIPGVVPPLDALPKGCNFSDRCPEAFSLCREAEPALVEVSSGHMVRCFLHHKEVRKKRKAAA
ncbi:ABC transporter ATP-binding protein [Dethiosulfatarculus sandiegensis]|uniref:Peptide ABC transporter substrate-binding protein n=1 Tax=Dethiosulfatarculus sandiegensis TaxID=1429043 RepID=A0A0D2GDX3_9BACT|nr:ABC transporter ATP-binding protein [Dethiosulfatarculus sandiegensis]KIX13187.1 peptide ABC transporter substrate-binding protein [Dethiosulfatarculus sandiegensis]